MPKTKSKRGAPRSTTSDQSQHAQAVQTGRNHRTRRSNADSSVAHGGVQPQIPVVRPQIPVVQPKDHFQPPQRVQPGVELTLSTAVGLVQEPGTYSRPQPSANPSFVPEAALSSEISRLLHSSLSANTNQAYMKKLHGVHAGFQTSAKANGYLLTETHFETKVKTICTHSGCSSFAEVYDRECPKDWKKFSGNCYRLLSGKKNWDSAKSACKALQANLADVTSESENRWLYKTFTGLKKFAWIDAADKSKEGEWRWSSSGKLLTYNAWNKGEPNDAGRNEDCGCVFEHKGKLVWADAPCTSQYQLLCKKKA
ncbi:CD209 antigen-like protein C isoform X1 [Ostrea edulis]|uniref:CD209 antigen-like protein C isoform X1 n=1 Tax=Ostrea edulis TaxID=37623 RepID=UPI0024AFA479|nr:CD209 antigen-like protein C isoform X1 [Ostrea edulis]